MLTDSEQREAAKKFAAKWAGRGYEKGDTQLFWISLLSHVFGVQDTDSYIRFEDRVQLEHESFIDVRIPAAKVLIEQKSIGKDLSKAIRQSDGSVLNPFQQAKRYIANLPLSAHPRYVITCNFAEFWIYDMERPNGEPAIIKLADLPKEYYRLSFIATPENVHIKKEMEISIQAGTLVGKMYDALREQYIDPDSEHTMKSLNVLCVRLVFCLYAEDAGVFGGHAMFHDYLASFRPENVRRALMDLFKVLDQRPEDRDPYMDAKLAAFPYVNGGLFADENIEIPRITADIVELIVTECSEKFDWSDISPTIFGAVFESTLNPETRRSGGMHYTSIENIHKIIDPLFLDDLLDEFKKIISIPDRDKFVTRRRERTLKKDYRNALESFQDKLASMKFLDPACGSGNFLTETYICLRRLENEVIEAITGGQMYLSVINPIKVSIDQFYGIEINDFAVTVAKTALWIAESQMMKETESIVRRDLDFLPLTTNAFIHEGNALRMDWNDIIPASELSYIYGNPPFVGYKLQSREQKEDLCELFSAKNLDYVAGWYKKSVIYMQHTQIKAAFVSTNSITQGEQVTAIWKDLCKNYHVHIDFAYRTFTWGSESPKQAHVHCVIIGFSTDTNIGDKVIFDGKNKITAKHINYYLIDAPDLFIEKRSNSICNAEPMIYGNEPREGGFLIISPKERMEIIKETPQMEQYIKRFVSSHDFINNNLRYCLWLVGAESSILRKSKIVMDRLEKCKEFRQKSKQKQAHASANTPTLFTSIRQPKTDYLLIPVVSSQNRRYIPIGYMSKEVIVSNACFSIPNATLYTFGIVTSNVHMAWTRSVCGRLKSDYRYSNTLVYNNFPWPTPVPDQKARIAETAQAILDARDKYPDSSLADLYDELTMPPELRKAHQENDKAVMDAYGFDWLQMTESDYVAELMKMYQKITSTT